MLNRLRYLLFGSQIQKGFKRAELAGRESSDYIYQSQVRDLENDLKALQEKHEREIDQLADKKLADLAYRFNPNDVLTVKSDQIGRPVELFLGKDKLTSQEITNLKNEASLFRDARLWKIITETLRSQAHEIIFNQSENFEDMRSGKMMLFNLGVQERIIHTLEMFALDR